MGEPARLELEGDRILLTGAIDFSNVMALDHQGKTWLREQAPAQCRLDLGGVNHCNSAIAALLLSWMRAARAAGKEVAVENLPEALQGIIRLAGLEDTFHAACGAGQAD